MIITVDQEKADDKMEWKFIVVTPSDVGLPRPMINVIMHCISSVFIRILWNNERIDVVTPT